MLVGEQPGDQEDAAGHPFVGPAGALLDRALEAAGIMRETVFVTNAAKHFRFSGTRGKRRIHKWSPPFPLDPAGSPRAGRTSVPAVAEALPRLRARSGQRAAIRLEGFEQLIAEVTRYRSREGPIRSGTSGRTPHRT